MDKNNAAVDPMIAAAMRNSIAADNVSRIYGATPAMLRDLRAQSVIETAYDDCYRFVGGTLGIPGSWIIEVMF